MSIIADAITQLGGLRAISPGRTTVLNPTDAVLVKSILGADLPFEYQEFAFKYGGTCFTNLVECPFLSIDDVQGIASFYGSGSIKTLTLAWAAETYCPRMPKNVLPIANDGLGNQICLGICGQRIIGVFLWQHGVDEEISSIGDLAMLATSFEELFRRLRTAE